MAHLGSRLRFRRTNKPAAPPAPRQPLALTPAASQARAPQLAAAAAQVEVEPFAGSERQRQYRAVWRALGRQALPELHERLRAKLRTNLRQAAQYNAAAAAHGGAVLAMLRALATLPADVRRDIFSLWNPWGEQPH